MKLVLFVEGLTESKAVPPFLRRWLDQQTEKRIGVRVVKFSGWADYYKEIKKKVDLHLTGKTGRDVVGAIGLLDLYGPTFYPPDKTSREERYSWAKSHVESIVDNNRFRQHFAVHETEAWLLAEPQIHPAPVARSLEKSTIGPYGVKPRLPCGNPSA